MIISSFLQVRRIEDSQDFCYLILVTLDSVRNGRVIINRVTRIKDIGMVSQNDLHLSFEDKDEFFTFVDRGLGRFHGGGFQGHDERLHVAVFFIIPQGLIKITIFYSLLGGKSGDVFSLVLPYNGEGFPLTFTQKIPNFHSQRIR